MSDNIPFDIQMEIIKRVPDVKSLIRFRSVSKQYKSFIDSSEFIKGYSHTLPHSHILGYNCDYRWDDEANYCLVDVDIETFKVQKQELAPMLKQYRCPFFVGASHGLMCWNGYNKVYKKEMLVIWNPSIRKSIGIVAPKYNISIGYQRVYSFGVCPVTSDPTVIEILRTDNYKNKPWHVKVFTLSSGVWNVIPRGNLPRKSITLDKSTPVVIDRSIYWIAHERIYMVLSFDLITKEFNVVDLPDSLKKGSFLSVSKLRESLVVSEHIYVAGGGVHCGVWVMEHDLSFTKLFTIGAYVQIVGFKGNGETILSGQSLTKLDVYDPCSQQIKNLGIFEKLEGPFFMGSYKESLLLHDHPNLHIYSEDSW